VSLHENHFPLLSHFYLIGMFFSGKKSGKIKVKKYDKLLKLLMWDRRFVISGLAVQIRPWAPNELNDLQNRLIY
jgi:hypothetical protein